MTEFKIMRGLRRGEAAVRLYEAVRKRGKARDMPVVLAKAQASRGRTGHGRGSRILTSQVAGKNTYGRSVQGSSPGTTAEPSAEAPINEAIITASAVRITNPPSYRARRARSASAAAEKESPPSSAGRQRFRKRKATATVRPPTRRIRKNRPIRPGIRRPSGPRRAPNERKPKRMANKRSLANESASAAADAASRRSGWPISKKSRNRRAFARRTAKFCRSKAISRTKRRS